EGKDEHNGGNQLHDFSNRSRRPLQEHGSKVLLRVSSAVKCLPNCFLRKWSHDCITGVGWVDTIIGELPSHKAVFIHHGAEIVEIGASSIATVVPEPIVELTNLLRWANPIHVLRVGCVIVHRQNR